MNYYTTGQFAKLANVSQRTIRYYDKIGLLKPSCILKNGYRQYSDTDLIRLQKIITLRNLDFSIEEIFSMMSSEESLKDSLHLQSSLVQAKITNLQNLKEALDIASSSLENDSFDWSNLISLVQMSQDNSSIINQYMTSKNLDVRIALHEKYSQNPIGWFPWLYAQIDFQGVNRLLEIGCGTGELWKNNTFNLRNREFFLSDSSEGMVSEVRKKYGSAFNCIVVDCEKIPFKDAYFDCVIANHVLFYLQDLNRGLSEIDRVLKPNGVLYCSTYGPNHMKEITALVQAFDSRITLSQTNLYDVFGLDNGKDMLNPYFSEVHVSYYPDALIVDEAQPLVDYIMSCHGNQSEIIGPRLMEFKSFVQNQLPLHITKEAGVFICRK
ncbi:MerR family transcriptional regulator [Absicoccus porci]|uniref:MerR family transcriptional regulator n=1 Tax=Absicoccus porci TaxID=2486576 RepID=UPI002A830CF1|nr:MerR family transcriptional regulator [Absicoccus porci]MDY4739682.1 MerR family transcriptional regulator [Absicoccus porci]